MSRFFVLGCTDLHQGTRFQLTIPKSKHYVPINNSDKEAFQVKEMSDQPTLCPANVRPYNVFLGPIKTLSERLGDHPFPLSQGPVLLPRDQLRQDPDPFAKYFGRENKKDVKSVSEVLYFKASFEHEESQQCKEWRVIKSGKTAWTIDDNFEVKDVKKMNMAGPATTRSLEVVYTCQFNKCAIFCACSICNDKTSCKEVCKEEVCSNCDIQCRVHRIGLPRSFDSETDQYTVLVHKSDGYFFMQLYSKIPKDCLTCVDDLLEHQVYHLVFHLRCKFCRHDMRVYYIKNILTVSEYEEAEKLLARKEDRTCECCYTLSKTKHTRKVHEERHHIQCENCLKIYANSTELLNHRNNLHVSNFSCACGSKFETQDLL